MILNRLIINRSFTKSTQLGCSKIKDLLENAASGTDVSPQDQADVWATSPYPEGAVVRNYRDQSRKSRRSGRDPRDTSIVLFPGQGSGYVGMAKKLVRIPEARDMFATASEVLG